MCESYQPLVARAEGGAMGARSPFSVRSGSRDALPLGRTPPNDRNRKVKTDMLRGAKIEQSASKSLARLSVIKLNLSVFDQYYHNYQLSIRRPAGLRGAGGGEVNKRSILYGPIAEKAVRKAKRSKRAKVRVDEPAAKKARTAPPSGAAQVPSVTLWDFC